MTHEQKLDRLLDLVEQQGKDIERIKRGLYGDPDNKTPGLIDRQLADEQRLAKLEKHNDRQKWWLTGVAAAATFVVQYIWQIVKEAFWK